MDFRRCLLAWKWQVLCIFFLCNWGWVSGQLRYSIEEETEPGTFVGNVAQDLGLKPVEISQRRLKLGSEKKNSYFWLNNENGDLTVYERIDRDRVCESSLSCILHVEISVENPLEIFQIEIEIHDINDNSPTFSANNHVIKITEVFTSPGARFPLEISQDLDVGINGVRQYALDPNPFFSLSVKNRKDGTLIPQLILEKTLDREEKEEHILVLTAIDGGEPKRSGSCQITVIVLDVNDNAPVFDQPVYKVSLKENVPEKTVITRLNSSDLDDGTNSVINYFFDGHTSDLAKQLFDLNSLTGDIYIKEPVDYEEENYYELSVRAVDKGSPELEGSCIIQVEIEDVNDNAPEISFSSLVNTIQENAPIGTVIGFINVKDNDSGRNGEVQLDMPKNLPFKIKPLKNNFSLVTDEYLDREKIPQYNIELTASDLGVPSLKTQTTILLGVTDINDNPPAFSQPTYNVFIKENNDPGTLLSTVSAFDLDEGINAELIYSIVESQIDGSSVSSFVYINPSNGNVYAQRSFDYEHIHVFEIKVRVEDSGSPKLFSNTSIFIFVLDANDNYPTVINPELSVDNHFQVKMAKSASPGYVAAKITAMDRDSGHNAWLVFHLVEPKHSSVFQVTPYTGEIRTLQELDETYNTDQQLVISISDHGDPPLSSTVTVYLSVADDVTIERHKSQEFVTNTKPPSDLTLYLIISLVAISLVSIITFVILVVRCLRKEEYSGSSCCFLTSPQSNQYAEQYKPTLYLNTDGTLKYMEVRMVPTETREQFYQTYLPPTTETSDFLKPVDFPQLKDMVNNTVSSPDSSWLKDSDQVS